LPAGIKTLLEDDAVLAVNKPAGVLTVPGRHGGKGLLEVLAGQAGKEQSLRLVHRLDKETSGVLLLAKTLEAQRNLSRQFRNREVRKEYLALVDGLIDADAGTVEAALGPHPRMGNKKVVNEKKGRASITQWAVEERFNGIMLLRCFPLTGRQHQIRVHLTHIGLPLLVDSLYSGSSAFYLSRVKPNYRPSSKHEERPLIARLTLHAEVLTFNHPADGREIRVEAGLPKDFRATLNQLRKLAQSKR